MSTLAQRITDYLSDGGLFNPEQANHDAVRDLLIECRAALAAAPAAPSVPAGYKLVPLEPTPEMWKAGCELNGEPVYRPSEVIEIYRDMLAAAPAAAPAWQPIETAPKDGTRILVSWPIRELDDDDAPTGPIVRRSTLVTEMNGGHWLEPDVLNATGPFFFDDYDFTAEPDLWQPLPTGPALDFPSPATADGSKA